MARVCLILLASILIAGRAMADPLPSGETLVRSRLLVDTFIRYGMDGHPAFCVIGLAVDRQFSKTPFTVPPSFYARFIDGQFDGIRFNPPDCPTPEQPVDSCGPPCGLITVFDYSAWHYPPPTAPWPRCAQEHIAMTQSYYRPQGVRLMAFSIRIAGQRTHSLAVIEVRPCFFFVQEGVGLVIE